MPRLSRNDRPSINPVYDRSKPLVIELEYISWHIPMIRAFGSLKIEQPEQQEQGPVTPKELLECYHIEELNRQTRRDRIEADPSLADMIELYLDWPINGNLVALRNFVNALSAYLEALTEWSGYKLAAIYTIWACNLFWEKGRDKFQNGIAIRERAIQLWEETEKLTGQQPFPDKVKGVKWDRLFDELGIALSFPRAG